MGVSKDLIEFLELEPYEDPYEDAINQFDSTWDDYDYMEGGTSYYSLVKCPTCKRAYNIIHFECGEYIDKCICPKDTLDPVYYCSPCDVIWDTSTDEVLENFSLESIDDQGSLFDDDTDYLSGDPYSPQMQAILNGEKEPVTSVTQGKWGVYQNQIKPKGAVTTTGTTTYNYKTCSHKHDEIKLYDGTPIYCSSVRDKSTDVKVPDFGLYADASWRPLWRNEFITWPDYGIPTSELMGLTQIFEAYYKAKNGEMVEIGCIGGHGRTGTILAIMYIASAEGKVNGKEAYKFVKKTYCEHAIESEIQEWYIDYAAAYWYGHEMPEKPKVKAGGNGWCQITDHYAMMLRGHQKCADKGSECKYWNQDWNTYNKSEAEKKANDYTNFYTALPKTKDYDYVFGGIVRYHDDANTNGCSPLDHYIMITTGHSSCIRLPGECTFWEADTKDWLETGTIGGESDWSEIGAIGDTLKKIYPTVEEWKVLQELNEINPPKTIWLGDDSSEQKDEKDSNEVKVLKELGIIEDKKGEF